MSLVNHVNHIALDLGIPVRFDQLAEDQEQFVGIYRTGCQVIVSIFLRVEVETAEHAHIKQPGNDLFDIRAQCMVAKIHQGLGPLAKGLGNESCHAPIANICMIESRFKHLVLHKNSLFALQFFVDLAQRINQVLLAAAEIALTGIVGSIGKPEGQNRRTCIPHDLDAFQQVIHGLGPDGRIIIGHGAVEILVLLE